MDVQFEYMCTILLKSIYVQLDKSTDIPLRVPPVGITMSLIYIKGPPNKTSYLLHQLTSIIDWVGDKF